MDTSSIPKKIKLKDTRYPLIDKLIFVINALLPRGSWRRKIVEKIYLTCRRTILNIADIFIYYFLYNYSFEEIKKTPYQHWIDNNTLTENLIVRLKNTSETFEYRPLISIVMPVWNVDRIWLEKAVESVKTQIYPNWELCIADDASTKEYIRGYLDQLAESDDRIKVNFRSENGNISAATNSAISLAHGEFIILMDNDDVLAPHALFEIAKALQKNPDIDVIYSDDDKITESGERYAPQFKPDWSPELLLSYMYMSHLFCFRRKLYDMAGRMRIGFEGSQDYDLALRITEISDRVYHIPKILYHWRAVKESIAYSGETKPESVIRGMKAVQDALQRRGLNGIAGMPEFAKKSGIGIYSISWPDDGPGVTILIPTKNHKPFLERCIDSIESKTQYKNYEIVVIDNSSDESETLNYLRKIKHRVIVIPDKNEKFSYAYIHNKAMECIKTEYVLFLNNDTEVINPQWLSAMMGYMSIKGVGITGAKLLYADNRIQHAGVILGLHNGLAGHAFKLQQADDPGYLCYAGAARNYSAVSAACMLIRRDTFIKAGGFNEEKYSVAYNDIDLCLKVMEFNMRAVYVPDALLYHHEGGTRGFMDNNNEVMNFKIQCQGHNDPFYNNNLSKIYENFSIDTANTFNYEKLIKEKPKILFVTHNLNFEGAPMQLFDIAHGLLRESVFKIEVASFHDGPLRQLYENDNVPVTIIDNKIKSIYSKRKYNQHVRLFSQWIKSQGFNIVVANTLLTVMEIESAKKAGIESIWCIHESYPIKQFFKEYPRIIKIKAFENIINPYRVIFVSDDTKELFQHQNLKSSFVTIHNSLKFDDIGEFCGMMSKEEARKEIGIENNKKMFLIVGTACKRKGQHDFVMAAALNVRHGINDTVYYIVGARDDDYLLRLKREINKNGLEDTVMIVMETKEVFKYYRAADVFVCCSYNESYPRIILEATAFGLPIITTPVFGIKEQVVEDFNALLFNPGDVEKLARYIERILHDDTLYKRLSKNSYNVLRMINDYEGMIDQYKKIIFEAWIKSY